MTTDAQTEARAIVRSASPTVRKLFDAIRESGSSEPDIADAAGVSHATLHYWRAGNRSPTIMLLEAVASVLGYNIELVKADHATALAAKDAELGRRDMQLEASAKVALDLSAQLAEARKALEPFALVAEHDIGDDETDDDIFWPISNARYSMSGRLRVGHLRAARSALKGGQEDG